MQRRSSLRNLWSKKTILLIHNLVFALFAYFFFVIYALCLCCESFSLRFYLSKPVLFIHGWLVWYTFPYFSISFLYLFFALLVWKMKELSNFLWHLTLWSLKTNIFIWKYFYSAFKVFYFKQLVSPFSKMHLGLINANFSLCCKFEDNSRFAFYVTIAIPNC